MAIADLQSALNKKKGVADTSRTSNYFDTLSTGKEQGDSNIFSPTPSDGKTWYGNLARGIAKTPLKFIGSGVSALESTAELLTGQKEKAAKTISKGSGLVRGLEKGLGYEEGDISSPYQIAEDDFKLGKHTLESLGAAAELSSYAMGGPAAKSAMKLAKGAKGAKQLLKLGAVTGKEGAISGAVAGAGSAAQQKDATVDSVLGSGALGAGFGFAAGMATPFLSRGYQGLKNWNKEAEDALLAYRKAEKPIDIGVAWNKRKPIEPIEITEPLNKIDSDVFTPIHKEAIPVSEKLAKKAKNIGFSESNIYDLSSLSPKQKKTAVEMYNMAEAMEINKNLEHPIIKSGDPIIGALKAIEDKGNESSALLDTLIDSMPKKHVELSGASDSMFSWLAEKNIIPVKGKKGTLDLDFSNSVMSGPEFSREQSLIKQIFEDIHPPQKNNEVATKLPKDIRILRKKWFEILKQNTPSITNPSNTAESVTNLIETIRARLNDPLSEMSEAYKVANNQSRIAIQALRTFKNYLGKDFENMTEKELRSKVGKIMLRLASNADDKPSQRIRELFDAAKELGIEGDYEDPRALIRLAATLNDLFELEPVNSLQGRVQRAGESTIEKAVEGGTAAYDLATGHPFKAVTGLSKLFKGDLNRKRKLLLKEMLKEGLPDELQILPKTEVEIPVETAKKETKPVIKKTKKE